MKNTFKKIICLVLCFTMILSISSIAFAQTLPNGFHIVSGNNEVKEIISENDDVQEYYFTDAMVIEAFEEVTGRDIRTVLTDFEIQNTLNNQLNSGGENKIVYNSATKRMDIYLSKLSVELIVEGGGGSAGVGILTKIFTALKLSATILSMATFLVPFIIAKIISAKIAGDNGIIISYEIVLVEKGDEWGYKYQYIGWEHQ